mmetsp:Transcript_11705/g.21946  ORF Transcript_11705/g.21946 Transcript_11705/m.21946 type:complete len:720 (+) Transcript_11705:205-2364(+)
MKRLGVAGAAAAALVLIMSTGSCLAIEKRFLESGEECSFPIEFKNDLHYDCVEWNDQEWCKDSTGLWGHCKEKANEVSTLAAAGGSSGVVINELLANGNKGQEDFVELYNGKDVEVDLTGWTLSDTLKEKKDADKDDADKDDDDDAEKHVYTFGGDGCSNTSSIPAGGLLLLTKEEGCSFEFGLGRKDSLTLKNAEGQVVDYVAWKKENALKGISYGRVPDGSGSFRRTDLTAGEMNEGVSVDKLREELPKGADVTDSCCNKLKKIGFNSNLPVIVIDTKCQEVVDEPKIRTQLCTCSDELDYTSWAGIEIRGSSSARDHEKKGMAVKLMNATGHDLKFPLLGLPKDEDWVLYGPETDRSIGLRNFLAYNISRSMGNYASRTKFVEVFLQDECAVRRGSENVLSMGDYHGVYLLEEKIKRSDKRVDVCKHNKTSVDITGGYIFKHDNDNIDKGDIVFPIKKRFNSKDKLPMVMIYPKGEKEELEREVEFLEEYLNGFEMSLQKRDFADPNQGYAKYIDVDSFIDYFLGTEITKNPDAYRGSTYMHKDCDKKVAMGPMWDYNEAFGMCCGYPIEGYMNSGESNGRSGGSAISTNGWRYNICEDKGRCVRDPVDGISHWYVRLMEDPMFRKKAAQRWQELRKGPLSEEQIKANFDEAMNELRPAAIRNYNRWKKVIAGGSRNVQEKWEREANNLREWLIGRMEWLDSELSKYNIVTHQARG